MLSGSRITNNCWHIYIYNCFQVRNSLVWFDTHVLLMGICTHIYIYIYIYVSVLSIHIYMFMYSCVHRGLVAHICVGDLCHYWFGLRAFCMDGVKSLAKPTLTYCQLGMCEQPSLKFVLKYNNVHLIKCFWKSRTSTSLFLPQYVNILRNVTQPFRRWVWSATWRHETGEQWVM